MQVRPVEPEEYDRLGELTVAAYAALESGVDDPGYEEYLRDVKLRATTDLVLVAIDDEGALLGGVTYVGEPTSPNAEFSGVDEAGFRMLAVSVEAQGRGAGEALVRECIAKAAADGRRRVVIHTTPWMQAAHRLYGRLGFRRAPELDWTPLPEIPLLGYVFDL